MIVDPPNGQCVRLAELEFLAVVGFGDDRQRALVLERNRQGIVVPVVAVCVRDRLADVELHDAIVLAVTVIVVVVLEQVDPREGVDRREVGLILEFGAGVVDGSQA